MPIQQQEWRNEGLVKASSAKSYPPCWAWMPDTVILKSEPVKPQGLTQESPLGRLGLGLGKGMGRVRVR